MRNPGRRYRTYIIILLKKLNNARGLSQNKPENDSIDVSVFCCSTGQVQTKKTDFQRNITSAREISCCLRAKAPARPRDQLIRLV